MDDEQSPLNEQEPATETAALAFARLDGRIALMSRAVEHLAAERASTIRKRQASSAALPARFARSTNSASMFYGPRAEAYLAGCLLWSFLPGVVARTLPEHMARHMVGEPTLWEAGTRIMRADSPEAWRAIADA